MSITVTCTCGTELSLMPKHAGKRARCTKCNAPVPLPAADVFGTHDGDRVTVGELLTLTSEPSSSATREPTLDSTRSDTESGTQTGDRSLSGTEGTSKTIDSPRSATRPATASSDRLTSEGLASHSFDRWEVGDVIDGKYEVKPFGDGDPYKEGGMAVVYLVRHEDWQMDLIVKTIKPAALRGRSQPRIERAVTRITREAESWIDLGLHPNVVTCYYVRRFGDLPYLFLTYVDAGDLGTWISRNGPQGDLATKLDIAIQICDGMTHAHSKGLIHRDLKPANVLLTGDGVAKVTDFGLVKQSLQEAAGDDAERVESAGLPGELVSHAGLGTLAYMPPEQFDTPDVGTSADVYSFGITLFELLSGRRPFVLEPPQAWVDWASGHRREWAQTEFRRVHGEARSPDLRELMPALPAELAGFVRERCLAKEPRERPQSFAAVRDELAQAYAEACGESCSRAEPDEADLMADALNNHAISLLDIGQAERAERLLDEALRHRAAHRQAVFNHGLLAWRNGGQTDDGLLAALTSAAGGSGEPAAWTYLRGMVHLERGDPDGAVREFRDAGTDPDHGASVDDAIDLAMQAKELTRGSHCCHELAGPDSVLSAASISPDGRRALAGTKGGSVLVWRLLDGEPDRLPQDLERGAHAVAFAADDSQIVGCDTHGGIQIWDAASQRLLAKHKATHALVSCCAIDSIAAKALLADDWGNLYLVAPPDYEPEQIEWAGTDRVNALSLSRGGEMALIAHRDGFECWHLAERSKIGAYVGHEDRVTCVAVSPDGQTAASGSEDGTVRIWETETGRCQGTCHGHHGPVRQVTFLSDGRHMVSAGDDYTLRVWDAEMARCVRALAGHHDRIRSLVASHAGLRMLSLGGDNKAHVWQIDLRPIREAPFLMCQPQAADHMIREERRFEELIEQAVEAQQGSEAGRAYDLVREAMSVPGFERSPKAMALLSDLATVGVRSGVLGIWDRGGMSSQDIRSDAVVATPDGSRCVSADADGLIRVWDLRNGECSASFESPSGRIRDLAIPPNGVGCAIVGDDEAVRVLEVSTGEELASVRDQGASMTAVAISESLLATGIGSGRFTVWLSAPGRRVRVFQAPGDEVHHLAISPDEEHLCSADTTGAVCVWHPKCRPPVRRFAGHESPATIVTFSPQGGYVLSGDLDGQVALWNLAKGREAMRWSAGTSPVRALAFSPEGRFVVVGTSDGTVTAWQLSLDDPEGPRSIPAGATRAHAGEAVAVAVSGNASIAVAANEQGGLSLIELDWELDFPEIAEPGAGPRRRGPVSLLPRDAPWPGVSLLGRVRRNAMHWAGRLRWPILAAITIVLASMRARIWEVVRFPLGVAGRQVRRVEFCLYAGDRDARFSRAARDRVLRGDISDLRYLQEDGHRSHGRVGVADTKTNRPAGRAAAAERMIQEVGWSGDTAMLLAMLAEAADPAVRRLIVAAVIYAEGTNREAVVFPVLIQALGDPDERVSSAARDGLVQFRTEAVPALKAASKHRDPQRRRLAADALRAIATGEPASR